MKEYDFNKTMISLRKGHDPAKIETLIEYFKSGEFDIKNPYVPSFEEFYIRALFFLLFSFVLIDYFYIGSKMCWDEMCFAMPAVMKKIHNGWRTSGNSLYSGLEVKKMLDSISSQACCLSICSVSWLCSYMQVHISRFLNRHGISILNEKVTRKICGIYILVFSIFKHSYRHKIF